MKKVALHNLGCKVNAYEMEVMQQLLTKNGYEIVPFDKEADIYIVNTCSVTNIADRKSRQMLHKAKKQNRNAIVVATGCYAQTDTEGAGADESIDLIIGNNRKKDLIQILQDYERDHDKTLHHSTVLDIANEHEYEELKLDRTAEHTRAYIKIQDGCNQFCSYCIIPYARGRVRSREQANVIQEIEGLAALGYKEVVLTGIHLSSYGIDFADGKPQLLELIRAVQQISGIERIRLGSLEPRIITEEFAAELSALDKLCPHFHLSLQSGCDETLKRMNRHYDTGEYYQKVELLRKYFHNPALTTDVIVGFPGETEEEFGITRDFLNKVHFYEIHVFKYSRRKGTRADKMPDQIPESVKHERSSILIAQNALEARKYRESYLNQQVEVLIEEQQKIGDNTYQTGHTREYIRTACRAETDLTNQVITGIPKRLITDEILEL
ncbi:MAG: tRNA (N(6)-L-threonylcarbamoyladenosine(37)-C(2))-methylthiotransferase MtaB [bacterium]|nr:tRNA (N(6)-L-threonylcarbamoyladenosine(37)-C(2))-methylthiotransferase MtaB [bacterium]